MPDASRAESFGPLLGDLDQSLWDMMSATALKYPERQAVASLWQPSSHCLVLPDKSAPESESVRWTYQQLLHASGILATSLSKLGCKPNMKLAAVLWNSVEWCLLFWATAKLRMTFVPIDPRNPNDAKSMLACSKPDVIVAQSGKEACSLQPYTAATDPSVLLVHCSQDEIRGWRTIHSLLSENFSQTSDTSVSSGNKTLPAPDRSAYVALVVFTSGTTGAPKGCLHTNRNLISQTCEYDPNGDPEEIDRWLVHTPVSHIFAINNTLRAWKTGGVVVFAAKSFDVKASLMGIQEEKCTIMPATPTLVKALLASPEFSEEKGSSLEIVSIAATTIRPDDIERCRRLGARHAVQAYGLSEGAPILSLPRNDELLRKGFHHGVGKVLPGAAVRICDPETRTVLCRTRVGELHVSGSSVISAYLNNENKDSFYEDEHGHWLITGDQGMMDEQGIVHINGRYKDMIIRGGENINPAKIETALMEFKDVEAQVFGVPDIVAGEVPVAVVRLPLLVSKSHLRARAHELGHMYALSGIYTLEELGLEAFPTTSSGKVMKRSLQACVNRYLAKASRDSHCSKNHFDASLLNHGKDLTMSLAQIWEGLTGRLPQLTESLVYSADSITLLQYCDAVFRSCGAQLYLQDLRNNDTIEKQARVLTTRLPSAGPFLRWLDGHSFHSRDALWPRTYPSTIPRQESVLHSTSLKRNGHFEDKSELRDKALKALYRTGMRHRDISEIIPIRESFRRMVDGYRPESYHMRLVFRSENSTIQKIRSGIESSIMSRPLFRAIGFQNDQGVSFHAVNRPSPELFDRIIVQDTVRNMVEAERIWRDDSTASKIRPFMFQARIIALRETRESFLSITLNHTVADALSLLSWHQDSNHFISDSENENRPQTQFRFFSDLFDRYQGSAPAREAVLFHVKQLRGISRLKGALWPNKRAPGWMISYDECSSLKDERMQAREDVWNGEWLSKAEVFRFPRVGRVVCLPTLKKLKEQGIEPALFASCAIALFNVQQTGASHAIFNTWESGRSWPFVPDWMSAILPPAMSIDGPTCQWILTITEVVEDETVLGLLHRLASEHEVLKHYEHVPWQQVIEGLRDEGHVAIDASFRQSFVWDVTLGFAAQNRHSDPMSPLQPMARFDWPDCGFFWNAFMADTENLFFVASWDTAQMNDKEVELCCDQLTEVMRKLAHESNWDRIVGEVFG